MARPAVPDNLNPHDPEFDPGRTLCLHVKNRGRWNVEVLQRHRDGELLVKSINASRKAFWIDVEAMKSRDSTVASTLDPLREGDTQCETVSFN